MRFLLRMVVWMSLMIMFTSMIMESPEVSPHKLAFAVGAVVVFFYTLESI